MTKQISLRKVVVIGKESVGKTQLIASLTGKNAYSSNFRGTTVHCELYEDGQYQFLDTPGILRDTDTMTTKLALDALGDHDEVLVVVSGTHLDEDLRDMLPLVKGKSGSVVITFWDKIKSKPDVEAKIKEIEQEAGIAIIPVDGRKLRPEQLKRLRTALSSPNSFPEKPPQTRLDWMIEPKRNIFDIPVLGQVLSLIVLFCPAWLAVQNANKFADAIYDNVAAVFKPMLETVNQWPAPLSHIFGGDYGFVAMGPFLILYAVPTVVVFAVILAIYKASGLVDRLTVCLHPLTRPFGLAGRDLVRVIMGFGCNVPAVINSRSCSSCSRGACVSAISFGSACSYQLPATIAVFAAVQMSHLTTWYLVILALTTLIYLRLTVPKEARLSTNKLTISGRDFLQWPSFQAVWREAWGMIHQFFVMALPVFFLICIGAALLKWVGAIDVMTRLLAPVMGIFNLPGDASLSVILGSIRKDGIAIGLLDNDWNSLKVGLTTPVQVMTVVYLAGVLLPCLVTLLTVMKEMSSKFAFKMVGRQVLAASVFGIIIAWGGKVLFG